MPRASGLWTVMNILAQANIVPMTSNHSLMTTWDSQRELK